MTTEIVGRCIYGETAFYRPAEEAECPGHIYSEAGLNEFQCITGLCEFHFDDRASETE